MMQKYKKQYGYTLIELMIAMVIALIVVAAVITLFVSLLSANNANLNQIKLHQEMRAVMTLMTRDIRRAGYNGAAADDPDSNPFSSLSSPPNASDTVLTRSQADSRITFAYDANANGILNNEVFGYQLANSTVQFCNGASVGGCLGNWQSITNPDLVTITSLIFSQRPLIQDAPLPAWASPDHPRHREITIIMSGDLTQDNDVTRTMVETIRIRNDHFEAWTP